MRCFFFVVSFLVFSLAVGVGAETVFLANFLGKSDKAVPDFSVNDPLNYVPENPKTVWALGRFGRNQWRTGVFDWRWGKNALIQITNLCEGSGYTPFPGVTDFKEGMIQIVVSFGDPDGFGIQFRKRDSGEGYMIYFGGLRKPWVGLFKLPHPCIRSGECLRRFKAEDFKACFLDSEIFRFHQLDAHFPIDNSQPLLVQIEVLGSSVKVWYKEIHHSSHLYATQRVWGEPILAYDRLDYSLPGGVGIWHESWSLGQINSIRITDALGYGTDPAESIAVGWEDLKERHAWKEREEYDICDINKDFSVDHWDVRVARIMIHDPRKLFSNLDADVNKDGKTDQADVEIIKKRAIEFALEQIEAAAQQGGAPRLQSRRKRVLTWGALKHR